jgi:hypothetical protein
VLRTPSSTSWDAIPHGNPTVNAIAECPVGSPYRSSVDVNVSCQLVNQSLIQSESHEALAKREKRKHTSLPSFHSTINLCCNMMRSRSPFSYFIRFSSWAQRVSSRFPLLGSTLSVDEKSPIQRRPDMIRVDSASLGKLQMALTRAMRQLSRCAS